MFDINDDAIRQIVFAIENKKVALLVDVRTGQLRKRDDIPSDELPADRAMYDLHSPFAYPPDWTSADGFHLMAAFAAKESDPGARDTLKNALESGAGVFRAFKDVLKANPETERRWRTFKSKAMQQIVFDWYNTLRELRGLDAVERGADEELEDLVAESFTLAVVQGQPSGELRELDRVAFCEAYSGVPDRIVDHLWECRARAIPSEAAVTHLVFTAKTPDENFAGFLWTFQEPLDDQSNVITVVQIYVHPAFRNLGLATRLTEFVFADVGKHKPIDLVCVFGHGTWMKKRVSDLGASVVETLAFVE